MPRRQNKRKGGDNEQQVVPSNQENIAINNIPAPLLKNIANKEVDSKLITPAVQPIVPVVPTAPTTSVTIPIVTPPVVLPPAESASFKPKPVDVPVVPPVPEPPLKSEPKPLSPKVSLYLAYGISILAVILLIVGLYILLRPSKFKNETEASITASSCKNNVCTINISYTIDGEKYLQNEIKVSNLRSPGETIKIDYDATNPKSFIIAPSPLIRLGVGGGLSFLAIIMIIAVWWYHISNKKNK